MKRYCCLYSFLGGSYIIQLLLQCDVQENSVCYGRSWISLFNDHSICWIGQLYTAWLAYCKSAWDLQSHWPHSSVAFSSKLMISGTTGNGMRMRYMPVVVRIESRGLRPKTACRSSCPQSVRDFRELQGHRMVKSPYRDFTLVLLIASSGRENT